MEGTYEHIAQAMLQTKGNIAKASRYPSITQNAMELRVLVKAYPEIRERYQELLAEELQDAGLHVAERILAMVALQDIAYQELDTRTAIEISKEISRLILEGKQTSMSQTSTVILTSREDAQQILKEFLG